MKKILLFAVISVLIASISVTSISAQSQSDIPSWVKGVADFWVKGNISDSEFGESISFLIEQNIIQVEIPNSDEYQNINTIRNLEVENKKLEVENRKLKQENAELQSLIDDLLGIDTLGTTDSYSEYLDNGCHRDYPYLWSDGLCYTTSEPNCPTNKPYIWSDRFCYSSPEYLSNGCHSNHPYLWSDGFCYDAPEYLANGCPNGYPYIWSDGLCYDIPEPVYEESTPSCDPSYPDVCIAPYPPDLDCGEIGHSNFRVIGDDPHGFDRDNDGIGCES